MLVFNRNRSHELNIPEEEQNEFLDNIDKYFVSMFASLTYKFNFKGYPYFVYFSLYICFIIYFAHLYVYIGVPYLELLCCEISPTPGLERPYDRMADIFDEAYRE